MAKQRHHFAGRDLQRDAADAFERAVRVAYVFQREARGD
jgi:hypothetical protein